MLDAFEIHLRRGYCRELAVLAGLAIIVSGAYQTLGLSGMVVVLLFSRGTWQALWRSFPAGLNLDFAQLHQAWLSPIALCLMFPARHIWVFRDEISRAEWAMLRRKALLACPTQPVGLSISR